MAKLKIIARTDYSLSYRTPLTAEMVRDYVEKKGMYAYKQIVKMIENPSLFGSDKNKLKMEIMKELDVDPDFYDYGYKFKEKNEKYFPLKEKKTEENEG